MNCSMEEFFLSQLIFISEQFCQHLFVSMALAENPITIVFSFRSFHPVKIALRRMKIPSYYIVVVTFEVNSMTTQLQEVYLI